MYNKPEIITWVDSVNDLDVHNRILHLMIAQTLNPRGGSYPTIKQEEMYLLIGLLRRDLSILENLLRGT